MINTYFNAKDDWTTIRHQIHVLLQTTNLDDETEKIMAYLDVVFAMNLLAANNQHDYIGDHVPGQPVLKVIADIVDGIANPHISARLLDILQINKANKFHNARLAIDAYFAITDNRASLSEKRDYLLRIIEILKGLGKGNKSILRGVFDRIKGEVLKANIEEECYSVTAVITALISVKAELGDYEDFITLLDNAVPKLWAHSKFECYRNCNDALARLLPDKASTYGSAVARAYIADADKFQLTPNASQHIIANLYRKALRILKGLGIKGEEMNVLLKKISVAQQKAVLQMGVLPPVKLSVNKALIFPEFDNVYQAVHWLISPPLPSKSKLEKDIADRKKSGSLGQFFLGLTMADAQGHIIGASDDNSKQVYIDAKMTREIYCKTIIAPMYYHFTERVTISEIELNALLYHSPFIPPERLSIYTRGLFHGFCGNLVEAVHLLVPQIENGLKYLLNERGTITRKLDRDVQTERSLQYYFEELKDVLNADLLFDLDGLLNDGFGDNLRHDLAHGLCETERLSSYIGLYTWWLSLKLSLQIEQVLIS